MRKLWILIGVIIAGGVFFVFFNGEENKENQLSPLPTASPKATTQTHTININEQGFSPSELTINRGDAVRFVNTGRQNHWPASGIHPVHNVCPGLDPLEAIQPGESFTFTFTEIKECPVHDHLHPFDLSKKARIIVQ